MTIQTLEPQHVHAAKMVMMRVLKEVWEKPESLDEITRGFQESGELNDFADVNRAYFHNGGTFLVLLDGERVLGTAGVRRLDEETCELKRMWLLPEARGQGWGKAMLQQLLDWSREAGYQRMRLDVFEPSRQPVALAMYRGFGFRDIPRYNDLDSAHAIFMERTL